MASLPCPITPGTRGHVPFPFTHLNDFLLPFFGGSHLVPVAGSLGPAPKS